MLAFLLAGDLFAIPDPGCYRRNPRCSRSRVPSSEPYYGDVKCPRGERLWILREDAPSRRRRPGDARRPGETRRPRRPDNRPNTQLTLMRVDGYLSEPTVVVVKAIVNGTVYNRDVEGFASITFVSKEVSGGRRRYLTTDSLKRHIRETYCRSDIPRAGYLKFSSTSPYAGIDSTPLGAGELSDSAVVRIVATYRRGTMGGASTSVTVYCQ